MYPRMTIDLKKIEENTRFLVEKCKEVDVDIMGVTKSFCADIDIVKAEIKGGIKYIADSRIINLKKLEGLDIEKVLLRLPMLSQIDDVVKYADISLNSELVTIKALNDACKRHQKKHKIILMIDLGDLREGINPRRFFEVVEEIHKLDCINLYGIGVNLTCYGGVIPDEENLGMLNEFALEYEKKYNKKFEIVSGGNSSSYYLIPEEGKTMPNAINNLRLGEIIILGRETSYGKAIKGLHDDAFIFEAEIIELKEKASVPKGEIGMNAFGETPTFEDKGIRKRAILAVGLQDVIPENLIPFDEDIELLGASSDHMIFDVTDSDTFYNVGDIIRFKLEYGALLALFTSEYVQKYKKL